MSKKKLLVGIAVWALSVALTLLIFFVVFNDYGKVRISGLVFILLAELVSLGVFIAIDFIGKKSERVMFNAGIYSFTSIYLAATIIVSTIFMAANSGAKWLGLLDGIFLILFAICFIVLFYMSNVIGEKNRKTLMAVASVKRLETSILTLRNNPKYSEFDQKLDKLYEAAKYCDCSVFNQTDEKIQRQVLELEGLLESDNEDKSIKVNAAIDDMLLMYKTRSEEVKLAKGGGF